MKQVVYCKNGEKRIYGELYLPKSRGPFPLVIYSHGYGYAIEEIILDHFRYDGRIDPDNIWF